MNFKYTHQKALLIARKLRQAEAEMVQVLQEIDKCSGYQQLGYTSLSAYMIGALKFSEAGAYHFITVSRKAVKVPELQAALLRGTISVSKAKTIAPVLSRENASQWLELAKNSTVRELERQVAREHPEGQKIERVRHRARDQVEVTLTISERTMDLLKRAQEVLRQKSRSPANLAEVLQEMAEFYVEGHDPIRRISRKTPEKRSPKERALLRDSGECQYRMEDGKKCGNRYWLDVHHIIPKAEGGLEQEENLITLCSAHHQMVHAPTGIT